MINVKPGRHSWIRFHKGGYGAVHGIYIFRIIPYTICKWPISARNVFTTPGTRGLGWPNGSQLLQASFWNTPKLGIDVGNVNFSGNPRVKQTKDVSKISWLYFCIFHFWLFADDNRHFSIFASSTRWSCFCIYHPVPCYFVYCFCSLVLTTYFKCFVEEKGSFSSFQT